MNKIKPIHLVVIALIGLGFVGLNPLAMQFNQVIILGALIMTVIAWATEAVNKTYACIFLLLVFISFGQTGPKEILSFIWSDTLLLIVTTTLLSVGIMKTGLVHQYVAKLLHRSSHSKLKLLLLPYLFGIALVFLIPQAFARVIIIGAIFNQLLKATNPQEEKAKQFLIFNGFLAITMTYMFFSNGDIVLNQAAINFAGEAVRQSLNFGAWFKLMAVPTFISCVLVVMTTALVFKRELAEFKVEMIVDQQQNDTSANSTGNRLAILMMGLIIIMWMTEGVHHISPWIPALIGVVGMFGLGILTPADLKSVNPHFLIFLMTVFSIGKVLGQAGITAIIFEKLKLLIPQANSAIYLLGIALIIMILHMCIGSSVATMSVVLPILIPLTLSQGYRAEIVTLMTYIIVNIHFLLPFHHATMMIGTAKQYYPDKYMLRLGSVMTVLTFILLGVIFFQWWHIIGAM